MPYILLPLLLLISLSSHAMVQKFGANEHNTVWISEGDNKFICSLKQAIPNYGEARFERTAGGKLELKIELIHPNQAERQVELISRPPLWRHERRSRLLGTIHLNEPSTVVEFGPQQARIALTELEQGLFPTIRYYIENDNNLEVSAAISSVKFQPSYNQFRNCLSQLMPYQFEYVEKSKFYFRPGRSTLSAIDKRRLNEVIAYVKADPKVKWAQIKGYTDSRGFRHYNDQLAERRAKAIRDYLINHGVDGLDITIKSYGERLPLKSNRTNRGRSENRVAIFTLFTQEPPPPEEIPEFEFENVFDTLPGQQPVYVFPQSVAKPPKASALGAEPSFAEPPRTEPGQDQAAEPPLVLPPVAGKIEEKPVPPEEEPPPTPQKQLFAPITADMVETGK